MKAKYLSKICFTVIAASLLTTSTKAINCKVLNCDTCVPGNDSLCKKCKLGFWAKDNKCSFCDNECMYGQCNPEYGCTVCKAGFSASGGMCWSTKCLDMNCETCFDSPSVCNRCKPSFWVKDGRCRYCDHNCEPGRCSPGAHGCVQCKPFFWVKEGSCRLCPRNCEPGKCISGKGCIQCKYGFELKEGSCYRKEVCKDTNCETCSDSNTCTKCKPLFWLKDGGCRVCDRNCENGKCDPVIGCTNCKSGFEVKNGYCFVALCYDPNCEKCSVSSRCSKCKEKFWLKDGKCMLVI